MDVPVRERTLWTMLYETAARSSEVLALNIEDLDRRNRRSKVTRKGSAVDIIVWQTGTARLLPRLLGGWTLHQLRHSALTRAAENGANTGTLLAYSGHSPVASLARYTRVSPDALTRWQASRDPHRRR
jgi:integrase